MSSASKLTIVPFEVEHFAELELQPSQAYLRAHTGIDRLRELAERGPAFSWFAADRLICCGGLREFGSDRGVLWSFVAAHAGAHFTALHRSSLRFLETVDRPLMQSTCRSGFEAGSRWLHMLGFRWSREIGPWGPMGVPHDLFERVR